MIRTHLVEILNEKKVRFSIYSASLKQDETPEYINDRLPRF